MVLSITATGREGRGVRTGEQHGLILEVAHKTLASITLAGTQHMATASGNQFCAYKKGDADSVE